MKRLLFLTFSFVFVLTLAVYAQMSTSGSLGDTSWNVKPLVEHLCVSHRQFNLWFHKHYEELTSTNGNPVPDNPNDCNGHAYGFVCNFKRIQLLTKFTGLYINSDTKIIAYLDFGKYPATSYLASLMVEGMEPYTYESVVSGRKTVYSFRVYQFMR